MAFSMRPGETGEGTISETQAITRLKQGDLSGLELLVQRYQVRAVHAAILIVHDRVLAEEIVQNSFFQAIQKIQTFDERRPFGPWFLRSVINAAIQEADRQKRVVSLDDDSLKEMGKISEWLVDPDLCPEDLVENQALYDAVWQALNQLPPNQRAAVILRYSLDHSEAEITRKFDRPLTTIKWWLHAARERLRRVLKRDYLDETEDQEEDHE
jgi:RNA polymerase sigma-70 factor (ECF subfamily)